MGRPRALVAVLAGSLLLAGCGSGPSQAGAAVVIGNKTVTIDQVQSLIDKSVREQPAAQQLAAAHKLDLVGREIVRQEILHDLTTKAAQREGLVVSPDLLAKALQKDPFAAPADPKKVDTLPAAVVSRALDRTQAVTDWVLQQELALKYLTTLNITFDFSVIAPDTAAQSTTVRERALEKAKQFAAGPDAAAKAIAAEQAQAQLQAQATGQQPASRSGVGQKIVAVQSPPDAATALFGSPPNSVIAFQPSADQAAWVIVVIRDRTVGAPTAPTDQTQQPTTDMLVSIGQRMLQPLYSPADFKINPRYGVWDLVAMGVAPSEATTTGVVLPVRGAAQPQR